MDNICSKATSLEETESGNVKSTFLRQFPSGNFRIHKRL